MPSPFPGMNPYLENSETKAELYAFNIKQEIPAFPIPLRAEEAEPLLELQPLLHRVYDRARLELAINYNQPCSPKLSTEDEVWLQSLMN